MKVLLFFLLLPLAHASELENFPCSKELAAQELAWKPKGEWIKKSDDQIVKRIRFSEWVEVKRLPDGVMISKIIPKKTLEITFKGPECKKEVSKEKEKLNQKFNHDKDIYKFITKKKKGVLYVWSPEKPFSIEGMHEITRAAHRLKLPLLIFIDKEVPDEKMHELRKLYGAKNTQRMDSIEMRMRLKNEYPAVLLFKNSKLLPEVIYGVEEAKGYREKISNLLK